MTHPLTPTRRVGMVADLSSMPNYVGVNIGGDTTVVMNCPYLKSYYPALGDTVIMLESQGDYVVIGTTVPLAVWHAPLLLNSFSNGTPLLQYRLNERNGVELIAFITSGATTASGTSIAALPVGFRPLVHTITAVCSNASAGTSLWLGLQTDGNVALHGTWSNGQVIVINCTFPLDA